MARGCLRHQVWYVPRRKGTTSSTIFAVYVCFDRSGKVSRMTTDVPPRTAAPWFPIRKRHLLAEMERLGFKQRVGRPPMDPIERQQARKEASDKYNRKLAAIRDQLGVRPRNLPLGKPAPPEVVQQVIDLSDQVNPKTQRKYRGWEIAIHVGMSQAFVSRVLNKKRRSDVSESA